MKLSVWDGLAIMILLTAAIVLVVVLVIFVSPDSAINPFPPPTLPPTMWLPSPTATYPAMPATWTPPAQVQPTQRPTSTYMPTMTPLVLPAP